MADEITLSYEGPAVADGELDAYSVGGAIIAFGDFLGAVSSTVYDRPPDLRTTVRGIRGDSFDVQFAVYLSGVLATLFGPNARPFFEYVKATLELYLHLDGKKPNRVTQDAPGLLSIENNHGTVIQIVQPAYSVVQSPEAGRAVDGFIRRPCQREGIERVSIERSDDRQVIAAIERVRAEAFRPLPPFEVDERSPLETTSEKWVLVESVIFLESRRSWRFNDGQSSFSARIEDERFLRRFNAGTETFGMGDQLRVRLRTTQILKGRDLKIQHVIEEIYEHRHGGEQLELVPRG
jgi:hypothetical protein